MLLACSNFALYGTLFLRQDLIAAATAVFLVCSMRTLSVNGFLLRLLLALGLHSLFHSQHGEMEQMLEGMCQLCDYI